MKHTNIDSLIASLYTLQGLYNDPKDYGIYTGMCAYIIFDNPTCMNSTSNWLEEQFELWEQYSGFLAYPIHVKSEGFRTNADIQYIEVRSARADSAVAPIYLKAYLELRKELLNFLIATAEEERNNA